MPRDTLTSRPPPARLPAGAAVAGLALSGAALAVVRPSGLTSAWHYLRELA